MIYSSGMTTVEFIESLIGEADISYPITKASWVMWLNAAEQLLYSEVIHDRRAAILPWSKFREGGYVLSDIDVAEDEAEVAARDLVHVYADKRELQRVSFVGGNVFGGMGRWYTDGKLLKLGEPYPDAYEIRVVYNARPALKRADNDVFGDEEIYLPPEFMPMLAAKLRGDAYKLANEDVLAAKWLADYNAQLEDFKAFTASHAPVFGE